MKPTTATLIKKARERAGMTQQELASRLHVAQNTLSGWEQGRHEPKLSFLSEIADICEVRLSWLLGEAPKRPASSPHPSCRPFSRGQESTVGTGSAA